MNIINIHNYTHTLPNKNLLLEGITLNVNRGDKVALVGENGVGKSSLLRAIIQASEGEVTGIRVDTKPYYVPQHIEPYSDYTVAEALGVANIIGALKAITEGEVDQSHFDTLGEQWDIEERALSAILNWELMGIKLEDRLGDLSGGERVKIFLAGIEVHSPELIIMDEPTNHLDYSTRKQLYRWLSNSVQTILVVSHDRELLNFLTDIYELSPNQVKHYAGNYDSYREQKEVERTALLRQLSAQQGELRRARQVEQDVVERRQRASSRGPAKSAKQNLPRIIANARASEAQRTTHQLEEKHQGKIAKLSQGVDTLREEARTGSPLKLNLEDSQLHEGKIMAEAKGVNFSYADSKLLWGESGLGFIIQSGDRLRINGDNGSGKTTLIKLLTGELIPTKGELSLAGFKHLYLDQDYSLIDDSKTVYQQAQSYNINMEEHQVKMHLARSQFFKESWDKLCSVLSGGEKMKLSLCSLIISDRTPDVLILDEPTNNLDLSSLEALSGAISGYRGTLLVISHDQYFIDEMRVDKAIELFSFLL